MSEKVENEVKEKTTGKKLLKEIKEWSVIIVIAVILVYFIKSYLFTMVMVSGSSMYPTLEDEDKVMVNVLGKKMGNIDRFDVVVFKQADGTFFVKRVIGLEGDSLAYHDDTLYIAGKAYEEEYLEELKGELSGYDNLTGDFDLLNTLGEQEVPKGHYFVMGDNRRNSCDSRNICGAGGKTVGFVSEEQIMGVVTLRTAPLSNIGIIK